MANAWHYNPELETKLDPIGALGKGVAVGNAMTTSRLHQAQLEEFNEDKNVMRDYKKSLSKKAEQEAKLEGLKTKVMALHPIAYEANKRYQSLVNQLGNEEAAIAEMNAKYWPGLRDAGRKAAQQIGADPTEIDDNFDPASTAQFLHAANRMGAKSDGTWSIANVTDEQGNAFKMHSGSGDVERVEGLKRSKDKPSKPSKDTQKDRDRMKRLNFYQKDYPGLTDDQLMIAEDRSKARYSSIEDELDIMMKPEPKEEPKKQSEGNWLSNLFKKKTAEAKTDETPPVPGARKAPDGKWYIKQPNGKYAIVGG